MYHPCLMVAMAEGTGAKRSEFGAAQRRLWRPLRRIGAALRLAEVALAVAFLSWSSSRVPEAMRLAAAFLGRLSALVLSTPFVFLLGNAIVLTLLARSRHLPHSPSASLYDDLLRHSVDAALPRDEDAPYEDKTVCFVETRGRAYRRSKSEISAEKVEKTFAHQLRRTVTDVAAEVEVDAEEEEQEEMSDEELRLRVEAFIAKQLKRLKAESGDVVTACDLITD